MEVHNFPQGSQEWLDHRATCFNASDAPAMAGVSKYKKRPELLYELATGNRPEIGPYLQKIFDKGHEYEALARPIAEGIIGKELFPIVASVELRGMKIGASFDGITLDESIIWEHKTINDELRKCESAHDLHDQYKIQMDQQLLVSGADKCLFMASDGTEDDMVFFWYKSSDAVQEAVLNDWEKFAEDLAKPEAKQEPVATRKDNKWRDAVTSYMAAKDALKQAQEAEKAAKATLVSVAGDKPTKGFNLTLSRVIKKGTVQYKNIPELKGVNLDKYRGESSESYRITIDKGEK